MKSVRIGVVGLGAFGEVHLQMLSQMPEFEVVSVCSRSGERAEAMARQYGARRWTSDMGELVGDPEIEAVDVANEVARHAEAMLAALEAGKHVFVEKPLSARLDETEAVLRLAEAQKRTVMVGYIERYDPRRAIIKQAVASGELGEVVYLYGRRNCGRQYLKLSRFHRWPLVIEPGIHTVDMLLWLAASRVERVFAVSRSHNEWGVDDTWVATLEFQSGAVGVIEQVWQVPKDSAAYWDQDNRIEVIGTEGAIHMNDPTDALWLWKDGNTICPEFYLMPEVAGQVVGALRNEFSVFARAIREGDDSALARHDEIYHATQVALAIAGSAAERIPIDLG